MVLNGSWKLESTTGILKFFLFYDPISDDTWFIKFPLSVPAINFTGTIRFIFKILSDNR